MWWNKNQWKIILPICALLLLTVAYAVWDGGHSSDALMSDALQNAPAASVGALDAVGPNAEGLPVSNGSEGQGTLQAGQTEQGNQSTPEVPNGKGSKTSVQTPQPKEQPAAAAAKPAPVEPQAKATGTKELSCTISISCETLLNNLDRLSSEKKDLVPADGWVLAPKKLTFYEGESVFNLLQRVTKQEKIHMEYENTPIYNSSYIEGIANLYEFDAGELSGWMYQVNDWFPNYGCSRYQPKDGDVIRWVFTCNLGEDVGGGQTLLDQKS